MSARSVSTELAAAHAAPRSGLLRRTASKVWKTFVAMTLCQSLVSGVLVIGWTYRLMQRRAVDYWSRLGGRGRERSAWPEWAVARGQGFLPLRRNVELGVGALLTTWTLTVPACVLWQFGWFSGWDNSFNKGYEQAFVGAGIAWLGIALFIAAMFYVPVAQARHAVTGQWRAFFDFRTNRKIIKNNRFSCLLLAAGYAAAGLPMTVLAMVPYFAANNNPSLAEMTAAEQLEWLETYFFWGALPMFVLFVALRLAATRIYAAGLVDLLKLGSLSVEDLRGDERRAFDELSLLDALPAEPPRRRNLALWASRGVGRFVAASLSVVLWFGLAAQTFVGQFFHYRPVRGWLNQPLIQAPAMRHIPAALSEANDG